MIKDRFIALIDKYLSGTATQSEQQLVETYLEKLEASGNAMLVKDEPVKEAMWQQIQAQIMQEDVAPVVKVAWHRRRFIRLIAVAASAACLLGLGLLYFNNKPPEQVIVQQNNKIDSVQPVVRHVTNTTGKEEYIQLPDSSWVVLANNSEVSYKDPFTTRRDVTLVGKAYFKVAKNKTKPFTVFSGAVATTALGTEFLVTAYKKQHQLTVRLYEGKVTVKAVEKNDWRMKKDFYLNPGQEFVYSDGALAKLRSFKGTPTNGGNQNGELLADDPMLPQNVKGSWYMFNNQSLGQVFDQLSFTYDTPIIYNRKDVQNKYFVGKFNKSDSLDVILKYITLTNKLKVVRKENNYYIIK